MTILIIYMVNEAQRSWSYAHDHMELALMLAFILGFVFIQACSMNLTGNRYPMIVWQIFLNMKNMAASGSQLRLLHRDNLRYSKQL